MSVANGSADLRDVGQVVLHLPHRLTHEQLGFVDALAEIGPCVGRRRASRAKPMPMPTPSRSSLGSRVGSGLRSTARRGRRRVDDRGHRARRPGRGARGDADRSQPRSRRAVRCNASRRVLDEREPYARLLDEELAAAGIPMHGPSVRTLAQSSPGARCSARSALADDDFGRATRCVRWMSSGTDPVQRRAGEGVAMGAHGVCVLAWCAGLTSGPTVSGERATDDDQAPLLAEFVAWLVEECGVDERVSWAAWADWARGFLSKVLGSPAARRRWPEAELTAYDAVERVVEDLRSLVEVEPGPISRQVAASAPRGDARRCLPVVGARFGTECCAGRCVHVVGVDLDVAHRARHGRGRLPTRRRREHGALIRRTRRDRVSVRASGAGEGRTAHVPRCCRVRRRGGGCSPRAAGGQIAHEAPWLADVPTRRRAVHRLVRRGAREPTRAGRVVARARSPRAASGGRPHPSPRIRSSRANPELARGFAAIAARLERRVHRMGGPRRRACRARDSPTPCCRRPRCRHGPAAPLGTSSPTCCTCASRTTSQRSTSSRRATAAASSTRSSSGSATSTSTRYLAKADQMPLPLDTFSWTVDGSRGRRASHP